MFVLLFFVSSLVCVHAGGYWDMELSTPTISVPYGSAHISVWEHSNDRGRYFAMPLVHLIQGSTRIHTSIVTGRVEMQFRVRLWSAEAQGTVFRFIRSHVNASVSMVDVQTLPAEKLRMVWNAADRPLADYQLDQHWQTNSHLPMTAVFKFTCVSRAKCVQLKEAMDTAPHMFDALELQYVIQAQRSARRQVAVTGRQLMGGELMTRLSNMPNASHDGTRYLTSTDVKLVASQVVSKVIGSVTTDSDYVPTGQEVGLRELLTGVLNRDRVSTAELQPHMWNSVFWNDEGWARPDKVTAALNEVFSKDPDNSERLLVHHQGSSGSGGGSVNVATLFNLGGSGRGSSTRSVRKQDILNSLRQRYTYVEWTGEQFRVKPMQLSRINLSRLNTSTTLATAQVQVSRFETVRSIKLRIEQRPADQTPSLARLIERVDRLESSWAHSAHFCVWLNGTCPSGFSTHRALAQYRTDRPAESNLYGAMLGSSSVLLEPAGTAGRGVLGIAVCCR